MVQLSILSSALQKDGHTQRDLARQTGLHETLISKAINGRLVLRPDEQLQIAVALGRQVRELFPRGEK